MFTGVKLEDRLMHRPPSAGKGNRVSPIMGDHVEGGGERKRALPANKDHHVGSEADQERKRGILEKLQQLDEFIF